MDLLLKGYVIGMLTAAILFLIIWGGAGIIFWFSNREGKP